MKAIILALINLPVKILYLLIYAVFLTFSRGKAEQLANQSKEIVEDPIEPFNLDIRNR